MTTDLHEHPLGPVARGLVGASVPRPSGTLAGHAAGLPFETLAHDALVQAFPGRAYRHHELLNAIFTAHPSALTDTQRRSLLGPPALVHLLSRGKQATSAWSPSSQFESKQDDTAESILLPDTGFTLLGSEASTPHLIDIKTHNAAKVAQPPNIISARKLVEACKLSLAEPAPHVPFEISYIAVKWEERGSALFCTEAKAVSLLKIPPGELYINWSAAMQIQFQPLQVAQCFEGSPVEWARGFVATYRHQLDGRIESQKRELADLDAILGA